MNLSPTFEQLLFFICNYICSCEDEGSDKEASVESDTEKSTEDEDSSETETVSGSPSESEEVRHVSFGARWDLMIGIYCISRCVA